MDELSIYRQWFEHITEKNEIVIMWSEIVIIFSCLLDGYKSGFLFSFCKVMYMFTLSSKQVVVGPLHQYAVSQSEALYGMNQNMVPFRLVYFDFAFFTNVFLNYISLLCIAQCHLYCLRSL